MAKPTPEDMLGHALLKRYLKENKTVIDYIQEALNKGSTPQMIVIRLKEDRVGDEEFHNHVYIIASQLMKN